MMEWLAKWLGASSYYEHAMCLTNDPVLIALYVWGDGVTFLSYMVIGSTLLVRRGVIMKFTPQSTALYGSFIFLCGLSHLTKTLTVFIGVYRLDVMVVAAMAAVSAATAFLTAKEWWERPHA